MDQSLPASTRKPRRTLRNDHWFWGVLLIGIGLRTALFVNFLLHPQKMMDGDSRQYETIAVNLLDHRVFSQATQPPYEPDSVRTPVYPLFIALVFKTFGRQLYAVAFVQLLLSCLSFWFLWRVATLLSYPERVRKVAVLFFALDVMSVIYTPTIMTETLFTCLLLGSASATLTYFQTYRAGWLILSGVTLGLSALCRPIAAYLFFALIPIFGVYHRGTMRHRFRDFIVYLFIFLLCLLPWLVRNERTFGLFHLTSLQGTNLLFHATLVVSSSRGITYSEAEAYLDDRAAERGVNDVLPSAKRTQIYQKLAMEEIRRHPFVYAKETIKGILAFFLDPGRKNLNRVLEQEPVDAIGFLDVYAKSGVRGVVGGLIKKSPVLILAFAGYGFFLLFFLAAFVVGLWRETRVGHTSRWVFPLCIVLYFALITGAMGASRFRVPVVPFLSLMAATGFMAVIGKMVSFATLKERTNDV